MTYKVRINYVSRQIAALIRRSKRENHQSPNVVYRIFVAVCTGYYSLTPANEKSSQHRSNTYATRERYKQTKMGNRSSSAAQQPQAPPALLSCAVTGDFEAFATHWESNDAASSRVKDRQDNNVLHALFSCRPSMGKLAECVKILDLIHDSLLAQDNNNDVDGGRQQLVNLYKARNTLGCTAIWILVAYGNVDMLEHVQAKLDNLPKGNGNDDSLNLAQLMQIPNHQGDSPLLATCSQGNLAMVQYLRDATLLTPEQFNALMVKPNLKGTTVLEIVVANGHEELLQYLLSEKENGQYLLTEEQLYAMNPTTGLSLFHICAERNFHAGLRLLLSFLASQKGNENVVDEKILKTLKDKNQANALHVACFCGNLEIVQVWVETLQEAYKSETDKIAQTLDIPDGQGRTAYWIAGLKGHDAICQLLSQEGGVQTTQPAQMVREIKEAAERRQASAAARLAKRPVDGNALLGG